MTPVTSCCVLAEPVQVNDVTAIPVSVSFAAQSVLVVVIAWVVVMTQTGMILFFPALKIKKKVVQNK
jgi:uroporphyrinogen-III synthase